MLVIYDDVYLPLPRTPIHVRLDEGLDGEYCGFMTLRGHNQDRQTQSSERQSEPLLFPSFIQLSIRGRDSDRDAVTSSDTDAL